MNNNQTWKIDGRIMNYAQLMAWKKAKTATKDAPKPEAPKEVEKPAEEIKQEEKLKEEGYDGRNSVEIEYDELKVKMKELGGYFKLSKAEQKKYSAHKKQLGK